MKNNNKFIVYIILNYLNKSYVLVNNEYVSTIFFQDSEEESDLDNNRDPDSEITSETPLVSMQR